MRFCAVTSTSIWCCRTFLVIFCGVIFFFGNCFWKPGGAASAAKIMKMMSKTSKTSVKGVMLISAITSVSCLVDAIPMLNLPRCYFKVYAAVASSDHARESSARRSPPTLLSRIELAACRTAWAGCRRWRDSLLRRPGGIEFGRYRRSRIVEGKHFRKLVGRDDHLLIVRFDARLEVVEENHGDNRDCQACCRGNQSFRDAGCDDCRRRVAF